jgi:phage-related protein
LALYENWEFVSGKLGEVWDAMKRAGVYAFEAIGAAAKAVWDGVVGVVKGSVNAMIGIINLLIRGMNRIRIDIPPWVPGIGGKFFGVGIPQVPYLATGGLITGPTLAQMGEGGRNEAVLPLNDNVYRQLGEGIAAARGGAGGAQVVVQYYGNGKWTREDAQGLGRMLVSELRSMGVK